jgi:hypothetical protein
LLREALTLHLALTACLRGEESELHDPQRALVWGGSRWPLSGDEGSLSAWFEVVSEGRSHQTRGLERLGLSELSLTSDHSHARTLLKTLTLSLLTESTHALQLRWGAWRLSEIEGSKLLRWHPPHREDATPTHEVTVSMWLKEGGEAVLRKALKRAQQSEQKAHKTRKSRKNRPKHKSLNRRLKKKPLKRKRTPKRRSKPPHSKPTKVKLRYE